MKLSDFVGDGLCAQTDPEAFFPEANPKPAKKICANCLVKQPCLQWALPQNGLPGVWGGTTERERVRMRNPR